MEGRVRGRMSQGRGERELEGEVWCRKKVREEKDIIKGIFEIKTFSRCIRNIIGAERK